ncbi:MAG TPA: alpha/beta hydrolase [Solirubrobacterales bacterium]|nr:alpha/beta hydrolase [Solirubrobacterales bacterium]
MVLPHDEAGVGPAVVLLHAGVADRTMWAEQLPTLAAAGYRAVAMDLPGFGEAPPVKEFQPWSDVLGTMDALELPEAALVGNSFGGAVALNVAVVAPERITSLMLVSAPPPGLEPSSELGAAWEAEESALERGDIEAAVRAVVDAWTLPDAPSELRDRVAGMQRRAFELQAEADDRSEAAEPAEAGPDALGRIDVPVLVASGEFDLPDFRLGAESLSKRLEDARGTVIAGAGHLAPLEQPEAFERLLLEFLNESNESMRP